MEFFAAVEARRSVRAFDKRPLEEEKLQELLRAANAAPSAGNMQAYEIFVARSQSVKAQLARAAYGQRFIADAPVTLVFLANPDRSAVRYGRRGAELYCVQDTTIACAFVHLGAAALGLGSTWVGAFNEEQAHKALGSPPGLRPLAILPIGYPAEVPVPTPRRPLDEVVHEIP